ncbi:ribbon-helix-helix domain-containing protein [Luminiphilus sp.]|nr:ribbon-helix-helix domain-containing protein [Luminiphilus sp.]
MSYEHSRVGIRALLPFELLKRRSEVQEATGISLSRLIEKAVTEYLTQRELNAKEQNQ